MLRVRVAMTSTIGGGPYLATHYFSNDATPTDAQNCVAAVGTFWGSVDNVMDSQISWTTEPEVAVVGFDGVITGSIATTPVTGAGAVAADSVPLASQALVRWFTPVFVGGRRIRGRTFVPGLTTGGNTNGRVTAATATTIQNAANALIADANTVLVIWSRVHASAASVSTASVWSEFASLRSRRD
jgi:hypothetical protein